MSRKTKKLTRKDRLKKIIKSGGTIYYAVKVGRTPGIYTSWNEVYKETHKFPGAKFKKFETMEKAEIYMIGKNKNTEISTN